MARQKMTNEQVQRQEMEVVPGKEEITETTEGGNKVDGQVEEESASAGSDASSTSSESGPVEMDEELSALEHPVIFEMGNTAEKEGNHDRAVQCFQAAIQKFVAEGKSEVSPEIADYWLAYGNILLKLEEITAGLFSGGPDDNGDDNLKIAWESLDVARVCYEKRIESMEAAGTLKKSKCQDILKALMLTVDDMEEKEEKEEKGAAKEEEKPVVLEDIELWTVQEHPAEVLKVLKNAVFSRLRLGDFCQVHMKHDEAVLEFATALQLCAEYGLPYSEGLQTAVPLAHSFVGLGDMRAVPMFKAAVKFIDAELPTADGERKAILEEFKPDLQRQLEDFESEEVKLVKESEQMAEEAAALEKMDDAEPVDLGRVGGSARRQRPQEE